MAVRIGKIILILIQLFEFPYKKISKLVISNNEDKYENIQEKILTQEEIIKEENFKYIFIGLNSLLWKK